MSFNLVLLQSLLIGKVNGVSRCEQLGVEKLLLIEKSIFFMSWDFSLECSVEIFLSMLTVYSGSRTIVPVENRPSDNCPSDNWPQRIIAPRKIAPLTIKFPPKTIPRTLANSPKDTYEWTEENYALSTSTIIKESFYQKFFFQAEN